MEMAELLALCAALPDAQECFPFGPLPVCYKAGPKSRLFAQVYPDKVTLRCQPAMGETWSALHPEFVARGCHCPPRQAPYFRTIALERAPDVLLREMLDHAYQTALLLKK